MRTYDNFEECKTDENANEDPIECVYLEVLAPGKGKRELNLHHVGVKPSSATIVVKVTEEGTGALARKNEIVRRVRRMKPWWSWIAEIEIEKIILSLVAMILACGVALLASGDLEVKGMPSNALWLVGPFILYAVLHILIQLLGIRTLATTARMTIFPQGTTTIGEGKNRFERTKRLQKTTGFFGNLGLVLAVTVIVALAL